MMIDDDISAFVRRYEPSADKAKNPEVVNAMIDHVAALCDELGACLFGFASTGDHRYYDPFMPIELTGFVCGVSVGLKAGHNLLFNERIVAKNDYFVSGLNAHVNRICCKDTRFGFVGDDTFSGAGGMARFRSSSTEKRDVEILRACFGDVIKPVKRSGFGGSQEHVGYEKVVMKMPF